MVERALAFGLLAVLLVIAGVCDWRTGRVPNVLTLPGIAAGVLLWAVAGLIRDGTGGMFDGAGASLAAMAAGLVPFAILYFAGGLGGGDVKLMAMVGAISASWHCVLSTAVYAFLLAAVMAVVVMVRQRVVRQTMRRILGAVLMLVARSKPELDAQGPRVPFAAAVALGGILAGVEHLLGAALPWSLPG